MNAPNPRCFYCFGGHSTARHEQALEHIETVRAIDKSGRDVVRETTELQRSIDELGTTVESAASSISDAVQASAAEITYTLEWTHAEAMWARERQIELLTGILDVALNPQAAQADELFRMAVDSIGRGRSEDAARLLEDSVRLNPGDYRAQISLGHVRIALSDDPGALEAFEAARDYARTDGYRKAALRRIGRTQAVLGQPEQAWRTATDTMTIGDPDVGTMYERSVFAALAIAEGAEISVTETITDLTRAIERDRTLHARVLVEPVFDSIRDSLDRSLSQLEQVASDEAARLAVREQRRASAHAAWGIPGAADLARAVEQAATLYEQRSYSAHRSVINILNVVTSTAEQDLAAACAEFEDGLEAVRQNRQVGAELHTPRLQELRTRLDATIGELEAHAFHSISRDASLLLEERSSAGSMTAAAGGFSDARSVLEQANATLSELESEVTAKEEAEARRNHFYGALVGTVVWVLIFGIPGAFVGALLGGVEGAKLGVLISSGIGVVLMVIGWFVELVEDD